MDIKVDEDEACHIVVSNVFGNVFRNSVLRFSSFHFFDPRCDCIYYVCVIVCYVCVTIHVEREISVMYVRSIDTRTNAFSTATDSKVLFFGRRFGSFEMDGGVGVGPECP